MFVLVLGDVKFKMAYRSVDLRSGPGLEIHARVWATALLSVRRTGG